MIQVYLFIEVPVIDCLCEYIFRQVWNVQTPTVCLECWSFMYSSGSVELHMCENGSLSVLYYMSAELTASWESVPLSSLRRKVCIARNVTSRSIVKTGNCFRTRQLACGQAMMRTGFSVWGVCIIYGKWSRVWREERWLVAVQSTAPCFILQTAVWRCAVHVVWWWTRTRCGMYTVPKMWLGVFCAEPTACKNAACCVRLSRCGVCLYVGTVFWRGVYIIGLRVVFFNWWPEIWSRFPFPVQFPAVMTHCEQVQRVGLELAANGVIGGVFFSG